MYFLLERMALLFFNTLVLDEESYQKYYPHKKSITVLNFPINRQQTLSRKNYKEPWRFIYAGVVHPLRGIWEMLEIIHSLNQKGISVTLDLVGELRPKGLQDEVISYLNQKQLNHLVTIHGKVDFTQVASLLSECQLGFSLFQPIPN